MSINFLNLFIVAFAVWRVSALFANEAGPFHFFRKLREFCARLCEGNKFCRELHLYELIECEYCNSVWFGTIFMIIWYFFGNAFVYFIALPLALSTWTIIIKHIVQSLEQASSYLSFIHNSKAERR